jgi:hypothetical protein
VSEPAASSVFSGFDAVDCVYKSWRFAVLAAWKAPA